jgi:sugar-specific transcriptional regulator TrmB
VIVLGSEALANALKEYGVTEKEVEVYILLVKRGAQKTGQITKQLKKNKGLVYRILKNLQKKGLVEATLEYPTRFVAVQFEKVIDSFIKSKQKEITRIIETKKDLVSDWKKINKSELESPVEKFVVIEERKRIFQKMSQMIKETNFQLSAISTVSDLVRAEQFGVFDLISSLKIKDSIPYSYRIIQSKSKSYETS